MFYVFIFVINYYMILKIIKFIKFVFYIYWRVVDYYVIYIINDICIWDISINV